jgi:hypothetical protein
MISEVLMLKLALVRYTFPKSYLIPSWSILFDFDKFSLKVLALLWYSFSFSFIWSLERPDLSSIETTVS